MSWSARNPYAVFLAVAVLFTAVLGWLGWRLLEQERELARQRRLDQLAAMADRITAALIRRLGELDDTLRHPGARLPDGAVLLRVRAGAFDVRPEGALLYYPAIPPAAEAPPDAFRAGEALEFSRNDPTAAAESYRALGRSPDPAIRTGALVRLGRALRKAGRVEEALAAYRELEAMDPRPIGRLPARLVALEARCSLYEQTGRRADLAREARLLYEQLGSGKWRLTRPAHEFQVEQARTWLGPGSAAPQWDTKLALSDAAEQVWQAWVREPGGKGHRLLTVNGTPLVASWRPDDSGWSALLVPGLLFDAVLRQTDYPAALTDGDGRVLLGAIGEKAPLRVERTPASSRLPWTLHVTSADDGTAEVAGRRRILAGSLALLLAMLVGVSYVVARAAAKELAVARLQADFVAAVSHEFRTPLSSICQMSELLTEDRWPSPEHRRRCHEILGSESSRLRRLVEGLLDFARMESGAATYRLEPADPVELVRAVVDDFRSQPPARGAGVRFTAADDVPPVRADREALGRALWNLLDNALKYSPEPARIDAEVKADGSTVAIRVRDRGLGIPPAEQKEIFRKFVRGSEAKSRRLKGTGIGLAMVRHIVEGHGGEIRLESELGRGSTFTILIPAERPV